MPSEKDGGGFVCILRGVETINQVLDWRFRLDNLGYVKNKARLNISMCCGMKCELRVYHTCIWEDYGDS